MVGPSTLPDAVRAFVNVDAVLAAAWCTDDGSADLGTLMPALRSRATLAGVRYQPGTP